MKPFFSTACAVLIFAGAAPARQVDFAEPMAATTVPQAQISLAWEVTSEIEPDLCSVGFGRDGAAASIITYVKATPTSPAGTFASIVDLRTDLTPGDVHEMEEGGIDAAGRFTPHVRMQFTVSPDRALEAMIVGSTVIQEHLYYSSAANDDSGERLAWRLPSGETVVMGPLDPTAYLGLSECIAGAPDLPRPDRPGAQPAP